MQDGPCDAAIAVDAARVDVPELVRKRIGSPDISAHALAPLDSPGRGQARREVGEASRHSQQSLLNINILRLSWRVLAGWRPCHKRGKRRAVFCRPQGGQQTRDRPQRYAHFSQIQGLFVITYSNFDTFE